MAQDPSMRASDADRDVAADWLRDAHAEGRLSLDEFQERLDQVMTAKTLGELAGVTRDLPTSAALAAPGAPVATPPVRYAGRGHVRRLWASWATVAIISTGVWVTAGLSNGGDFGNYWPIWGIGPWGAVLLARTFFGAERERPGRQDGERDHR
jgi:Domain of unknown function (DUF1707)